MIHSHANFIKRIPVGCLPTAAVATTRYQYPPRGRGGGLPTTMGEGWGLEGGGVLPTRGVSAY